jgi:chromosome segregation ATPase
MATSFLIILIAAGFVAVIEITRSINSVAARIDFIRRDLVSLSDEVAGLSSDAPSQRHTVETLQAETDDLDDRLSSLRREIAEDMEHQQQLLTALEENTMAAFNSSEIAVISSHTATEDTAALGTALVALQGDLNETNSRVDALGGEIDELRAENDTFGNSLGSLTQSVDTATEAASGVTDLEQTLALFQVWELIARARLRLAENNVGLATRDVERAFRAVDTLMAIGSETNTESLQIMRTRLALTFGNLPDDPLAAANDLESAWDELERILTVRVLPQLAEELATATAEPTPGEISPIATPTPGS